ncbi:MAG: 30S ribosomal protein S4, partial [Firmicutes bacterium]|nr:30S ribosomal protein S4 [Bacillota bacterium]
IPAWLDVDFEKLRGTVVRLPNRDEIDAPVTEQLIVEWYSRV